MKDTSFWIRFVLAVLATWRITHLISSEDGPADLIVRLRARLGNGLAGQLMDCFKCLSIWVALPAAVFVGGKAVHVLVTWLAISGATCLIQRAGEDPVVIRQLPDESKGIDDGMLWSKKGVLDSQSVTSDNVTGR
ncbi:MAG TPA: hypothetical protein VKJ45_19565 [Blastocatellia bacterium]|nr:hypothetical protein [Blastocatellia bacterium]